MGLSGLRDTKWNRRCPLWLSCDLQAVEGGIRVFLFCLRLAFGYDRGADTYRDYRRSLQMLRCQEGSWVPPWSYPVHLLGPATRSVFSSFPLTSTIAGNLEDLLFSFGTLYTLFQKLLVLGPLCLDPLMYGWGLSENVRFQCERVDELALYRMKDHVSIERLVSPLSDSRMRQYHPAEGVYRLAS
jgi:hypothetical protein